MDTAAFAVNYVRRLLFVVGLSFLCWGRVTAETAPPGDAPDVMQVCAVFCGTWTWGNGHYDGVWTNGAQATLTVSSFTPDSILIYRTDTPASVSYGLTAVYTGKIDSPGKASGSVTLTWPGVAGFPATTPWTATWVVPPPTACTISATTLAHVPGTDDSQRALTGRIGVGENVVLTLTSGQAAAWSIISGGGPITADVTTATQFPTGEAFPTEICSGTQSSAVNGVQACFIAPSNNDSTVITATLANGESCSTTFTTVQPSGMIFQRLKTPRNRPDYLFSNTAGLGFFFEIEMESVAFVTPGDVSFANVLFKEKDTEPYHYDHRYNSLFNIDGTYAWLVGCDHDKQHGASFFNNLDHSESPFAFSVFDGNEVENETDFSVIQTEWLLHYFVKDKAGTAVFSKKQIAALSANGAFNPAPVPDTQASILEVSAVNFNDFVLIKDPGTCLIDVKQQFTSVSSP